MLVFAFDVHSELPDITRPSNTKYMSHPVQNRMIVANAVVLLVLLFF
jgi:hypothetical protein